MELRPNPHGQYYDGPVRVPVTHLRTNNYPGVIIRPLSKMKTADYIKYQDWCEEMANRRRKENKKRQQELAKTGHDGSLFDPLQGPLVGVKILKTVPLGDGRTRILFRRKDRNFNYNGTLYHIHLNVTVPLQIRYFHYLSH